MNRFKFRAWPKTWAGTVAPAKMQEFTFADIGCFQEKAFVTFDWPDIDYAHQMLLDECEVMQCTGLKDKNARDIYDGDILSFDGYMTADDSLGIEPNGYIYDEDSKHAVWWNEKLCGWEPKFDDGEERKYMRDTRWLMLQGSCEVIGNVYENPELLTGL